MQFLPSGIDSSRSFWYTIRWEIISLYVAKLIKIHLWNGDKWMIEKCFEIPMFMLTLWSCGSSKAVFNHLSNKECFEIYLLHASDTSSECRTSFFLILILILFRSCIRINAFSSYLKILSKNAWSYILDRSSCMFIQSKITPCWAPV